MRQTDENIQLLTEGKRRCPTCKIIKILDDYHNDHHSKYNGKKKSNCIDCCKKKRNQYCIYNITSEQFNSLIEDQNNLCLVCKKEFSSEIKPTVDHDHSCCNGQFSCGKCIRGILCKWCNTALGLLNDNSESLLSAINYLKRGSIEF